ncbi:MAG: M3 family oligoendopeptidase [Lachnospiraceae bacterium]|nr:M3 family oligoendopeptidase [Lachnospiraceae bacterium]
MKFHEMPYERPDLKECQAAMKDLMDRLDRAGSKEEKFEIHKEYYKLRDHIMTMSEISMIRNDADMTDPVYEEENKFFDESRPILQSMDVAYAKKLREKAPELIDIIGPVAFKNMEIAERAMDDKLIPLMQEENALSTRYGRLLATAKIDWEGEELNLSLMTPYLRSSDRNVRKAAYEKYTAFFAENQEELDEIYDLLVKNRTAQGRMMGYENFVPLGYDRMQRNSYDKSALADFRAQVKKDWVPFAEKIHQARAERIGVAGNMSYIDEGVYFLNGNPAPTGTPEEILAAGGRMYDELSPETSEFFRFMQDNELFDVLGRKTKRTGGYMTFLPDYNAPFIFANFNGTSGDVDVITHECGHAFQGYLSGKDPIREHADITMDIAEIHSMSMEFFTEPWYKLFFGDRADDYTRMHLEDSVCFIPYGTMVDEFQHIVYENPDLTPRARRSAWRDLERQYKPHLDYTGNEYYENGGFWQKQAHIYEMPFYYIDYCLSQTCSFEYKVWMDENYREAWESYLKLCRLSASDFYGGLLEAAGLEIPFNDGCLKHIADKLQSRL